MDLGSVRPGYRLKPWCIGKQLLSGFNLTGHYPLTGERAQARELGGGTNKKEKMIKKYYGLQVHTLTFLKVDESGESVDGKQYEYTGDHSGFCDGIEDEYLEEI